VLCMGSGAIVATMLIFLVFFYVSSDYPSHVDFTTVIYDHWSWWIG